MKLTKRKAIITGISIVAVLWLFHVFFKHPKAHEVPPIAVSVQPVIQKDVTIRAHAIGSVQSYNTVSVRSRVDGQLISVGFKEGEEVTAGQVIFAIDPAPYTVALQQAEANLARDLAQLTNYQALLARYNQLSKKGFLSKQDYDQAKANMEAEKATVAADNALVDNAKLNLSYCTIKAPISGRTGSLLVNQGNLIKATDSNPLLVINQITPIYILFSLPEKQLNDIKQAQSQTPISVDIHPKDQATVLQGHISFINNTVDSTTGMIEIKALFPNEKEELWPGQYVDVDLPLFQIKQALMVPTRAIQEGPDGSYLYVVENHKALLRPVTLGPAINEMTLIKAGVDKGATVIITGQSQLISGSEVAVDGESTE